MLITKLTRLVSNAIRTMPGTSTGFDGNRDLYEVCGYPGEISIDDYFTKYRRGGIAKRIVNSLPKDTWREKPDVIADEAIIEGIKELDQQFQLYNALKKLDTLSRIGRYGVLLFGVADGATLDTPFEGGSELLYLQPHSERSATIEEYEEDQTNPRFGLPLFYSIEVGAGEDVDEVTVHHSRILHIAEDTLETTLFSMPALEDVWNYIWDLEKVIGSSAETFYQNAAKTTVFSAREGVEWDESDKEEMEKELEKMYHGLDRNIKLSGVDPHILATAVVSPKDHISSIIELIASTKNIPKRILMGTERGELASSQDENAHVSNIQERRDQYATPNVLMPLFRRFQAYGWIPDGDIDIEWPEEDMLGEDKRSIIADRKATALHKYTSTPTAEFIVSSSEFREWLGLEGDISVEE